MNKLIYILLGLILFGNVNAQNPYDVLPVLTLSDGRYDEIHEYKRYERVGSAIMDMETMKIVSLIDRDSIQNIAMTELDMTTRFLTVDPLAEKYPEISPYAYCVNNPILFIDPDGREVWIYYQDENGDEQKMQYTAGMEYSGDNEFVSSSVKYLNQMSSTEAGGKVIGSLIGSENAFNMTNTYAQDKNGNDIKGALAFAGSEDGGGQIHAAELLSSTLAEGAKLESAAHELFHGYQHENGQGGASIFNEVEAMVFGVAVSTQYSFDNMTMGGGSSTPLGKDESQASQAYQNSFQQLLYNESFPKSSFVSAVKNFKQGAAKNTTGMYNRYPLRRSNQTKSMLGKLYPLIK